MKKEFNPYEWLPKTPVNSDQYSVGSSDTVVPSSHRPIVPSPPLPLVPSCGTDIAAEVDTVIARIEAAFTDITTSYSDWLNVGFAFASEFGEAGRAFFHRVSRFYTGYTKVETDKQYDQCLRSHGQGITISTFFYMAMQAGIEVRGRGSAGVRERGGEGVMERGGDQCSVGSTPNPSTDQSFNPSEGSGQSNNSNPSNPSEGSDQCSVGSNDSRESGIVPSPPHSLSPSLPHSLSPSEDDSVQWSVGSSDSREFGIVPSPPHSLSPSLPLSLSPSEDDSDQCSVGSSDNSVPSPPRPLVPSSFPDPSPDSGLPIEVDLPTFPEYIFPTLPHFFQRVVARAVTPEERDILLIGSLVTLSSCLHRVYGIYDDRKVYPNLFTFITAQASAGKGKLVFCKNLVNLIHWSKRDQCHVEKQKHEIDLREYNLIKGKDLSAEKPEKPPELLLFIPANSSSTGVFQLLSDNDGRGLIFETEGDTLAQAFKTDYGNYSDGFRKAFHHETINYYRRTDREYVEIQEPCISAMLSGTPRQIQALIPSAEDGLSSRFIYYRMNLKPVWKDVFASGKDNSLVTHFNELGKEFYSLYKTLSENPEIQFCFTEEQQKEFHRFFTLIQDKYLELQGTEYMATIRRLGLICFRMAMIFSSLRILETGDFSPLMECRDEDFHAVLEMIRVLVRHASHIFSELPENEKQTRPKNKKEIFFDKLPERFTSKDVTDLAQNLAINERTAARYIATFCEKGFIHRDQQGKYTNLSITKLKESQPGEPGNVE